MGAGELPQKRQGSLNRKALGKFTAALFLAMNKWKLNETLC